MAVGAKKSQIDLQVDANGVMASKVPRKLETYQERFEVISLDEFTHEHNIAQVALMKIDTEGMEIDILNGSQETLKKTNQVIMETHGEERHNNSISRLQNLGFKINTETFCGETGMVFASR